MTKNIVKTALVLVGTGSLLTGCNFDQPEAGCFVQESPHWAVKYELVEAAKDANGAPCEAVAPTAEMVGVYKYVNPETGASRLALRPQGLASRGTADNSTDQSEQTALGDLATERDGDDFCAASNFPAARVNIAVENGTDSIVYEYSNVRVYSAPSAPGTQLTGELRYTKRVGAVECTSTYVMSAIWPAVGCDPESDSPADNCGEGSGLNPDFAATCITTADCAIYGGETNCCVPSKPIPSFK